VIRSLDGCTMQDWIKARSFWRGFLYGVLVMTMLSGLLYCVIEGGEKAGRSSSLAPSPALHQEECNDQYHGSSMAVKEESR
jgi:hypothetical protein